eukprot:9015066-Alexandrium_andersonii.AAC.1
MCIRDSSKSEPKSVCQKLACARWGASRRGSWFAQNAGCATAAAMMRSSAGAVGRSTPRREQAGAFQPVARR